MRYRLTNMRGEGPEFYCLMVQRADRMHRRVWGRYRKQKVRCWVEGEEVFLEIEGADDPVDHFYQIMLKRHDTAFMAVIEAFDEVPSGA